MISNNELTIGISTTTKKEVQLIEKIFKYDKIFNSRINFILCIQGHSNKTINISHNILIIYSETTGLSRSRNIVIENCISKWLWFQDDDINVIFDNVKLLLSKLKTLKSNVVLTKILSSENSKAYKNYNFHNFHNIFNSFKASSIEIIVNVQFIRTTNILYDVNFGLGTELPSCEENLFLFNIFSETKLVTYLDLFICKHTTVLDSRSIDYFKRYNARGALLRRLPLFLRFVLFAKWVLTPSQLNLNQRIKCLVRGYNFY